ncbi:MAG TPA: glycosyltransferase family 2 protein [Usitatibacter sp.]|jgi:glycosyltransferase involved in cell wall biosynthesis
MRAEPVAATTFVVIPAFNEAATIRELVVRTLESTPHVIVVDDGSTDGTGAQLLGLPIALLTHEHNLGKAASLWRGLDFAMERGAGRVVTLDGDGQHDPADIGRLLHVADLFPQRIVIGARLHDRRNFPPRRYYANQVARFWISWAAGEPIADTQSGFRVYPACLLAQITHADVRWGRFVFESEILIAAGARGVRCIAVPIPGIYPPAARRSHFRPFVDIARIVLMVAGRLLRSGMNPLGLWRSLRLSALLHEPPMAHDQGLTGERIGGE